jgi:predicted membrane channel-forming protein YqfA (hemolysin III family)
MNSIPWIMVGILVGVVVLGILMVVVVRRRKEPRRVDYRNYFVMGVIWLAFAPSSYCCLGCCMAKNLSSWVRSSL